MMLKTQLTRAGTNVANITLIDDNADRMTDTAVPSQPDPAPRRPTPRAEHGKSICKRCQRRADDCLWQPILQWHHTCM